MEEKLTTMIGLINQYGHAIRLLQLQVARFERLLEDLLEIKYGTHVGAKPEAREPK